MSQTVKYLKETDDSYVIGGYGVIWGGRDLVGEYFSPTTDFWFDRITATPPVLYEHGMDGSARKAVLGQVVATKADPTGLWIEAQLEKSREYVDAVMQLVKQGVLGWSSGAVSHLVEKTKSGHLTVWPVAEFSLTPDPAEPRTIGVQELDALADEPAVKSLLAAVKALPDGAMPISGDDGAPPDGSYEALAARIGRMAQAQLMAREMEPDACYGAVLATFPDAVIYCHEHDDYYRIGYTIGADGWPILGAWEEIAPAYVPVLPDAPMMPMDLEAMPVAMAAARSADLAAAVAARTKAVHLRRSIQQRSLSDANRRALRSAMDQWRAALTELDVLLDDASSSGTKDQADALRRKVAIQAAHIRMLAS